VNWKMTTSLGLELTVTSRHACRSGRNRAGVIESQLDSWDALDIFNRETSNLNCLNL